MTIILTDGITVRHGAYILFFVFLFDCISDVRM